MAEVVGADVAGLREAGTRLMAAADQLDMIAAGLSAQLGQVQWRGADAERFRARWTHQCRSDVAAAAGAIREAGEALKRNADEQEQASSANGGNALVAALVGAVATGMGMASARGSQARDAFLTLAKSGSDPHRIAEAWRALSRSERDALIREQPELIGGLNGIPGADRSAANKSRIADLREKLESQEKLGSQPGTKDKLASLAAIEKVLERHPDAQLLTLDLSGERAMAAIGLGDVDHAKNVSVFTPGLNSTVNGSMENYVGQMESLRQQCNRMTNPGETAVVAWIGYQAPQTSADSLAHVSSSVVSPSAALSGGKSLAGFLSGIDASRQGDVNLTAIGHSYGSTTTAAAMLELAKDGKNPVDAVAFFGSPGLLTKDAADFALDNGGQSYVLEAKNDVVADLNWFGRDAQDVSGVTNLSTEGSSGHSQYLADESRSQHNLAAVATGQSDRMVLAPDGTRDWGDRWLRAGLAAGARISGGPVLGPAIAGGLLAKDLLQ